jgi:hypothetical protein
MFKMAKENLIFSRTSDYNYAALEINIRAVFRME